MSLDVPMPDLPRSRLRPRRTAAPPGPPPAPPTRGTKRRPSASPPPAQKRPRTSPPAKKRRGDAPGARPAKRVRTSEPAPAPEPAREPAQPKRRRAAPESARPKRRRRGARVFTVGLGDDDVSDGQVGDDVEEIFDASGEAPAADAPVEPQVHAAVLESGQVLVHVRHADGTLQRIVVEKPV